jgi:hypothetical protein
MAEVVGIVASGITLAVLLKTCLDAFDLIRAAEHHEFDLKKLTLKLAIEKCRLYIWGESVGLTIAIPNGQPCRLDSSQFSSLAKETLDLILHLFTDTQKIKDRYGCKEALQKTSDPALPNQAQSSPAENLAASFSNFKISCPKQGRVESLALKSRWVIHDKKKFTSLLAEVKDLIDGLQNITKSISTVVHQELRLRNGIQQINNSETLDLLAEACGEEYPQISDAASARIEALSLASSRRLEIEDWSSEVDTLRDKTTADIESLTVTELKHSIYGLLQSSPLASPPSKHLSRLGLLRVILENLRTLQRSINPRKADDYYNGTFKTLESMAYCVSQEYGNVLSNLLKLAENENITSAKLIYMEALEEVEIACRQENEPFLVAFKSVILSRLISIHRVQGNLPALERIWKSLHNSDDWTRSVFDSDTATRLAAAVHSSPLDFWGALWEVFKLPIDLQLYPSSETLSPALDRAYQADDESVQQIFQSTASAIKDTEKHRKNADNVHVSSGETASLDSLYRSEAAAHVATMQGVEQSNSSSAPTEEIADQEYVFHKPRHTLTTDCLTICTSARSRLTSDRDGKSSDLRHTQTFRFALVDCNPTSSVNR